MGKERKQEEGYYDVLYQVSIFITAFFSHIVYNMLLQRIIRSLGHA